MRRSAFLAGGAALAGAGSVRSALAASSERNVVLRTSDGVHVYGVKRAPSATAVGVLLLFHQAGSSADEYTPIAPRLVAMGYATLAIDQRSGGTLYGRNFTVAELGKSQPYLAVIPDLDAAIAWAQKTYPNVPVCLWGSSYSAALTFVTAAKHRAEIAKVLAFSPGEYLSEGSADPKPVVAIAAKRVTAAIFVDSAADQDEIEAARRILGASPSTVKVQYVPEHGVHGSSTLRKDKDPAGYDENWEAVTAFLARPAV